MNVIGLAGLSGCGKSTVAKELQFTLPKSVILPFAGALKELAKQIGWNGRKDTRGRKLLQILGTDVCRDCIDENYWVYKWVEQVPRYSNDTVIICDDVRFPNEAEAVRSMGGKVFQLHRKITHLTRQHKSERPLPNSHIDIIMTNNDLLADAVDRILSYMSIEELA